VRCCCAGSARCAAPVGRSWWCAWTIRRLARRRRRELQFTTTPDDAALDGAPFAITFERDGDRVHLTFDDSGVQDWAFVAMLPQLWGDDPVLRAPARETPEGAASLE
jgi:hypothetical protein